ncbi:hypothetical protein BD410DRAFT_767332 [Rickenella mellea]|uniref:AA9 family lytic polysaccharide monooxygenase n=1 Tax=Rickenella mellea TaxID=50990 RepID=A0A4Y7Q941_9AGAM|nr:hypothetical protein BD410DRAFT_767332 [Rickenella mellea]
MRSFTLSLLVPILAQSVRAHTTVWSVWVNGVDQGSGKGIRHPAYNGPPLATNPPFGTNSGFANGPVRDLSKIEMRCNVMGDIPAPDTIKVKPGDTVTLEWHHNNRTVADDIVDTSHKGPGIVYLSPDPPVGDSWVKIQQEAETTPGNWYTGGRLNARKGKQDVVIPQNLAPGFYLLRGELLALHESDVAHTANLNRGIQIYIACIQLQVTGTGTLKLPTGVTFPGAYQEDTPGIVYNLYISTAGQHYTIPGPPVWTAAAPSPTAPAYGPPVGFTINPR